MSKISQILLASKCPSWFLLLKTHASFSPSSNCASHLVSSDAALGRNKQTSSEDLGGEQLEGEDHRAEQGLPDEQVLQSAVRVQLLSQGKYSASLDCSSYWEFLSGSGGWEQDYSQSPVAVMARPAGPPQHKEGPLAKICPAGVKYLKLEKVSQELLQAELDSSQSL